jgi:transposase
MLQAITAAKKKNDRIDAERVADCSALICCRNKMSGLLMEVGAPYSKRRLHGKQYFGILLGRLADIPDSIADLLKLSRSGVEMFESVQKRLLRALRENATIRDRVERLMSIPGVWEITALTWVLEVDETDRFRSLRQAASYCGLCSAQREFVSKEQRGPLSKKRNKHLQTALVEVANIAPLRNPLLGLGCIPAIRSLGFKESLNPSLCLR